MRHRLATYTPDIDREAWTLYGGLFLLVMFGNGTSVAMIFEAIWNSGVSFAPGTWFLSSLLFGFVPAVLAVLFLKAHRYAYPPDR